MAEAKNPHDNLGESKITTTPPKKRNMQLNTLILLWFQETGKFEERSLNKLSTFISKIKIQRQGNNISV